MDSAFARFESIDASPELKGKRPPGFERYHVRLASGQIRQPLERFEKARRPEFAGTDIAAIRGSVEEVEAAWNRRAEDRNGDAWIFDSRAARDLAILGDRARARERILRARSTSDWTISADEFTRREGDAILAWSEGRMDEADRFVGEIFRDSALVDRWYGYLLAGSLHFASGDCPGAAKYLEEARAVPWPAQPWYRSYNLPLILHRLASCYEKMGDLAKARERNDELLKRWERADPDIPLLVEAKELQARLGGASAGR